MIQLKFREQFIREAIHSIEEDSCLEFEDITDFMDNYMKRYEKLRRSPNYFSLKPLPVDYPDYL